MRKTIRFHLAGAAAGIVNGLFGGGGGALLVPALSRQPGANPRQVFSTALAIIYPACLVSAGAGLLSGDFSWSHALPYLAGGTLGGIAGGLTYDRVPLGCLRFLFALFLLYGGVRYLL